MAGGHGKLAFELLNLHDGFDVTVVDPRPLEDKRLLRKWAVAKSTPPQ